jgi:diketogulonate reductase-like aldo/keto reductase
MSETPEIARPPGRPLPRIALGCGNFGGVGSAPEFFGLGLTTDQAFAMMDAAWESGITHFDTADAYGGGRSEAAIGRWIATRLPIPLHWQPRSRLNDLGDMPSCAYSFSVTAT